MERRSGSVVMVVSVVVLALAAIGLIVLAILLPTVSPG
jgi:hypothetical protein